MIMINLKETIFNLLHIARLPRFMQTQLPLKTRTVSMIARDTTNNKSTTTFHQLPREVKFLRSSLLLNIRTHNYNIQYPPQHRSIFKIGPKLTIQSIELHQVRFQTREAQREFTSLRTSHSSQVWRSSSKRTASRARTSPTSTSLGTGPSQLGTQASKKPKKT